MPFADAEPNQNYIPNLFYAELINPELHKLLANFAILVIKRMIQNVRIDICI